MKKRKWCYAYPPQYYCIDPCDCGNEELQWSEFESHLWCSSCQKDFIPPIEKNGIFSGPIPLHGSEMLGIYFDRIDLITDTFLAFDSQIKKYTPFINFLSKQNIDTVSINLINSKKEIFNGTLELKKLTIITDAPHDNYYFQIFLHDGQRHVFELTIEFNEQSNAFNINTSESFTNFVKLLLKNNLNIQLPIFNNQPEVKKI